MDNTYELQPSVAHLKEKLSKAKGIYSQPGEMAGAMLRLIFICGLLSLLVCSPGCAQQRIRLLPNSSLSQKQPLVCSPDTPILIGAETSVALKVWSIADAGEKGLTSRWTALQGHIGRHDGEVRWDLNGLKPGTYQVTVTVDDSLGNTPSCSIQVIVPKSLSGSTVVEYDALRAGPKYLITRTFLLPNKLEEPGYGLYSYLLFSTPPDPADATMFERYVKILEVYLRLLEPLSRFEHEIQPSQLNVTHVPVKAVSADAWVELASLTSQEDTRKWAEWLVEHYDYARGQIMLHRAGLTNREGPYLLSSLNPLGRHPVARPFLIQDLSGIPPEQAGDWLKEFINQTAQERFWEPRALSQLTLKMKAIVTHFFHRAPPLAERAILGIIVMK